jgi:hypothetical protein
MSDPEIIERDLREYLDKEPNLSRADRLSFLKTIFHKHLGIDSLKHVVTYDDLFILFSEASKYLVRTKLPVQIGNKVLETNESIHLFVMEVFIHYLNRMNLLRKNVTFDYKKDYKE